MILSTTFPSKILKTKKRLSEDRWSTAIVLVAIMGLFAVLALCFRVVTLPWNVGRVIGEIPVMSVPLKDPAFHGFVETPRMTIGRTTPTVVMTTNAFYFGDIRAFSSDFGDPRNKYILRNVDGEPQLVGLVQSMERWIKDRERRLGTRSDDLVVFIPSGDIPMPIVIQVMAGLRKSERIDHVILGTGIM